MVSSTKSNPLKALTERQLKAVQVLIKHDAKIDISETTNWKMEWEARAEIVWADSGKLREELSRALGQRYTSGRQESQLAVSLFNKGALSKIADIELERESEARYGGKRRYRKARYTISNEIREASGSIAVALEDLQAKEQRAVDALSAWDAARSPLDKEASSLTSRESEIRRSLGDFIKDTTADRLLEAHRLYHQIVSELGALNVRLQRLAGEHKRKYEPYTLRGW